jgi:hypothetical protein
MDYNIIFAYDDKSSSTLKVFNKDKTYPYSVFIDSTDKVLIKTNNMVTYNDLFLFGTLIVAIVALVIDITKKK